MKKNTVFLMAILTLPTTIIFAQNNLPVSNTGKPPALGVTGTSKLVNSNTTVSPLQQYKAATKVAAASKQTLLPKNYSMMASPAEVTDLANIPLNSIPIKTAYPISSVGTDCNILPVNYKSTQDEFSLFCPLRNFKEGIFPGAVYQFSTLKNQSPVVYTKFTNRNPMDLSTQIFDSRATEISPARIAVFDIGSISSQQRSVMARYPGSSARTTEPTTEIISAESFTQLNADLNTGGAVDIATKFGISLPVVPISIGLNKAVFITSVPNVVNKTNTIILRFKQIFYTSTVNAKAGTEMDVFPGINKSQLEPDLVYIHSVDYGQQFYVAITSTYSKETLYNALINKLKAYPDLGIGVPAELITGLRTTGKIPTPGETNRLFNTEGTVIKAFDYNGTAINLGSNIDEVLNNLKAKSQWTFDASNSGVPLSYTLNFVADHSTAYVNSSISYAITNCGKMIENLHYDVSIKLVKLYAPKVIDVDESEDLFGKLMVSKFQIGSTTIKTDVIFWQRYGSYYADSSKEESYVGVTSAFKDKFTDLNFAKAMARGVTNAGIKGSKFFVTGDLWDKEIKDRKYVCNKCENPPREVNLGNYIDAIEALQPGETTKLSMDEKDFFVLDFYENGDKSSSHVRVFWSVEITAH